MSQKNHTRALHRLGVKYSLFIHLPLLISAFGRFEDLLISAFGGARGGIYVDVTRTGVEDICRLMCLCKM